MKAGLKFTVIFTAALAAVLLLALSAAPAFALQEGDPYVCLSSSNPDSEVACNSGDVAYRCWNEEFEGYDVMIGEVYCNSVGGGGGATKTPVPTNTPLPTWTFTPTPSQTPTPSRTPTSTASATPSRTSTLTPTPSPTLCSHFFEPAVVFECPPEGLPTETATPCHHRMLPWVEVVCPTPTAVITSTPTPDIPQIEGVTVPGSRAYENFGEAYCGGDTEELSIANQELDEEYNTCLVEGRGSETECAEDYERGGEQLACEAACNEYTACCYIDVEAGFCGDNNQCVQNHVSAAFHCRCNVQESGTARDVCHFMGWVFFDGFLQLVTWIVIGLSAAIAWSTGAFNTAWSWTQGAANSAWDWTQNAANDAWNWTSNTAKNGWKKVKGWFR
jgi:hypothetical protein